MATKSQFHLNSKVKTSILTLNYRDKWAPNCIHSLLCQIGIANYHQWRFSEIVFFFFARSCAIEETILSLSLSLYLIDPAEHIIDKVHRDRVCVSVCLIESSLLRAQCANPNNAKPLPEWFYRNLTLHMCCTVCTMSIEYRNATFVIWNSVRFLTIRKCSFHIVMHLNGNNSELDFISKCLSTRCTMYNVHCVCVYKMLYIETFWCY